MATNALESTIPSSNTVAVKVADDSPDGMVTVAGTTKWPVALLASETTTGEARLPLRDKRQARFGEAVFSSTLVTGITKERAAGMIVKLAAKVVLLLGLISMMSPAVLTETKNTSLPAG